MSGSEQIERAASLIAEAEAELYPMVAGQCGEVPHELPKAAERRGA